MIIGITSTCQYCSRIVPIDDLIPITHVESTGDGFPLSAIEHPSSIALAANDDGFLVSCEMWCDDCARLLSADA